MNALGIWITRESIVGSLKEARRGPAWPKDKESRRDHLWVIFRPILPVKISKRMTERFLSADDQEFDRRFPDDLLLTLQKYPEAQAAFEQWTEKRWPVGY